jgi:hypothetical protein
VDLTVKDAQTYINNAPNHTELDSIVNYFKPVLMIKDPSRPLPEGSTV